MKIRTAGPAPVGVRIRSTHKRDMVFRNPGMPFIDLSYRDRRTDNGPRTAESEACHRHDAHAAFLRAQCSLPSRWPWLRKRCTREARRTRQYRNGSADLRSRYRQGTRRASSIGACSASGRTRRFRTRCTPPRRTLRPRRIPLMSLPTRRARPGARYRRGCRHAPRCSRRTASGCLPRPATSLGVRALRTSSTTPIRTAR